MVLRHHNEAESLNAVQKMDWEWKLSEISSKSISSSINSATATSAEGPKNLQIDDLYIPMVHVSDDFDLADNR